MKSLLLLIAAAASGDYELVISPPAPEPICAKSLATCQQAIIAVRDFGLFFDLRITELRCRPHPGCFPESSNVIRGYNDLPQR